MDKSKENGLVVSKENIESICECAEHLVSEGKRGELMSLALEVTKKIPNYLSSDFFKSAAKAFALKDESGTEFISFILELAEKGILDSLLLFDIFKTAVETYISNGKNDDEIISLISKFKEEKIPLISKVIKEDPNYLLSRVFDATFEVHILSDKRSIAEFISLILKLKEKNPDYSHYSHYSLRYNFEEAVHACIWKHRDNNVKLISFASELMEKDPTVAFNVVQILVSVCTFENGKSDAEMNSLISGLIEKNKTCKLDIVCATISVYIRKYQDAELESLISEIIKGNPISIPGITGVILNSTPEERQQLISKLIKENLYNRCLSVIVRSVVNTYISEYKDDYIKFISLISEFMKSSSNETFRTNVIRTAVEAYILNNEKVDEIISFLLKFKEKILIISKITGKDLDYLLSDIFQVAINVYIWKNKDDNAKPITFVSKLIEKDPTIAFNVTRELIRICVSENGKSDAEMDPLISGLIENNSTYRFDIVCATISIYIQKYGDAELESLISEIIKGNPISIPGITGVILNSTPEERQQLISKLIKENPHYYYFISVIVRAIIKSCTPEGKITTDLISFISKLINENPNQSIIILRVMVAVYILNGEKGKTEFVSLISGLIEKNPVKIYSIVRIAIENKNYIDIKSLISELIGKNPVEISNIVRIAIENKSYTDIKLLISELIEKNPAYRSEIACAAVEACYFEGQQPIEKILDIFEYCIEIGCEAGKEKLKSIFLLILSKYFADTLMNGAARSKEMEEKLLKIGNGLSVLGEVTCFDDIKLESLSNLANFYLENRFNSSGVKGCKFFEVFLKGICDVMVDVDNVKTLYGNISLFENFKFFDFDDRQDITSIAEFLAQFGLREENFTVTPPDTNNNYLVIHCSYLHYSFIMVIDRTKSWKEVISGNKESGAMKIMESCNYILNETVKSTMPEPQKTIFGACDHLSNVRCLFQENGTDLLNAVAALCILLQAKKEALEKGKTFTMEDIKKGFEKGSEILPDFEHKIVLYLISNIFTLTEGGKQLEKSLMDDPNWKQNSSTIRRQKNIHRDLPIYSILARITIKRLLLEFNGNRLEAIKKGFPFGSRKIGTEEQRNGELSKKVECLERAREIFNLEMLPQSGLGL